MCYYNHSLSFSSCLCLSWSLQIFERFARCWKEKGEWSSKFTIVRTREQTAKERPEENCFLPIIYDNWFMFILSLTKEPTSWEKSLSAEWHAHWVSSWNDKGTIVPLFDPTTFSITPCIPQIHTCPVVPCTSSVMPKLLCYPVTI